jgi:hypothetical protein
VIPRSVAALIPAVVPALILAACSNAGGSHANGPCGPCRAAASDSAGAAPLPRSAKLETLAQQRVEVARKRLQLLRAAFDHGAASLDDLFAGFRDVAFAARDSGFHGEELRRILTDYRDAVLALRDLTKERAAKGAVGQDASSRVDALVAEAEYWLGEADESGGPR